MADHSRLGRGLAALMGDVGEETQQGDASRKPRRAPVENLSPNPRNPRRAFTETELGELAASIKERGIIQPIVVRAARGKDEPFEIIAGERRWRAAQRAGLHQVPITIVEATDAQALEFAIIENVQRADLNPMEEAAGYQALMDEFNHTQEAVAEIVGKSRPYVANALRLLKLPAPVQQFVRAGKLSAGHARLLVGHANAQLFAEMTIDEGYSVRQLEEWLRAPEGRWGDATMTSIKKKIERQAKNADTRALEKRLSDSLGLKVTIDHNDSGSGTLHIKYRDLDQLDGVTRKLGR